MTRIFTTIVGFTFLCLFIWAVESHVVAQDDPVDSHVACDNSGTPDSTSRYHTCDCNRAHAACDPAHPKPEPMYGCKTYCKPDHCDCSTRSCS